MHFTTELYDFLADLADNNDRDWFNANKARYEAHVKGPALRFIADFAPLLADISPHFRAVPKVTGGSLFRIYRDTRFSKDKTPYKTHTGVHFRHEAGKDVHAPGFYLHLEPGNVGMGVGIWHPDNKTLGRIRDAIVAMPDRWQGVLDEVEAAGFGLMGDSLKRAPRGYDPDHPFIEDLKRKDVAVYRNLDEATTLEDSFMTDFAELCREAMPLNRFCCEVLGRPS